MVETPSRVTIVGLNYTPEPTGIAPYTAGLARGLQERGHRVQAVTGLPHYPQWHVAQGYPRGRRDECIDGVPVRRVRHRVPADASVARRAAMELEFGLRSALTGWARPHVVVVVSPALLAARQAVARAHAARVPAVVWVQDIYTLGIAETGGSARQQKWVRAVERSLLRSADSVVVIHDRFRDQVRDHLGRARDVHVVRNWSHIGDMVVRDRDAVRQRLGWRPEEFVVLHAGNMGAKQGLENVVEAARLGRARGSRIRFVLLGDGNRRTALEAAAHGSGLQLVGSLPEAEFTAALGAADALLVNELPGLTEMSVPSKLTTYFATGLPVLAAAGEASTTTVEMRLSEAGLVVPPGDPGALLLGAEQLAVDPGLRRRLGEAGRRFRRAHLTESAALDRWEGVVESLRRG